MASFSRKFKLLYSLRCAYVCLSIHMLSYTHPDTHILVRPLGVSRLQTLWCLGHCSHQSARGVIDLSERKFSHAHTL